MSTPGMNTAPATIAFRFENAAIRCAHTAPRTTGRRAASAVPSSPSLSATARAISSTGKPCPGGTRTMLVASTYGTTSASVTATIGTPA